MKNDRVTIWDKIACWPLRLRLWLLTGRDDAKSEGRTQSSGGGLVMTPLCINCDYYNNDPWQQELRGCLRKTKISTRLVNGKSLIYSRNSLEASVERSASFLFDRCGPEGKYFKPKEGL